jgi:hypothetical protein
MSKLGENFEEHSDVQEHCSMRHSQVQEFLENGLTIITLQNLDKLELARDKFLSHVSELFDIRLNDIDELRVYCQHLSMYQIGKIRNLKLVGISQVMIEAMGNTLDLFSARSIYLQRFPHFNLNVASKAESVTVSHNEVMAGHAPSTFVCYVPFHDIDDESGLYLLDQNRTMDIMKKTNNFKDTFPSDNKIQALLPDCVKLAFGQAVVFNAFVFHGAYPHDRPKARISMDFRFQDIKFPLFEKNLEYFSIYNA